MRRTLAQGALVGALLTAPLTAVLYLGDQLADLPFVPFDLFGWLTQRLPGPVITFGLDLMIDSMLLVGLNVADTAKLAEQIMAVLFFFVFGTALGAVLYWFFARYSAAGPGAGRGRGLGAAVLFGAPLILISLQLAQNQANLVTGLLWLAVLFLVWGLALDLVYRRLTAVEPVVAARIAGETDPAEAREVRVLSRRQFLVTLGAASASITVAGSGVGALLARSVREQVPVPEDSLLTADGQALPNAGDPVVPAPGTRLEYTPLADHYKVFIGLEPTRIEGENYRLPITGLVDNPLSLSLEEIRANYAARDQFVTLSCISGRVGTTLISTTRWTGASLQDVLASAGVRPEARYLVIRSGDEFHETLDLEMIAADERIMLCYDWDGQPLPSDHGFPLRVWIPDRFGMKQPKWITEMELVDEFQQGYWVSRGWDEVAQVKTTSVVDTVAVDSVIETGDQRLVPVGGIAFSGDRGISRVEVRVDGGEWQEAQLRTPLSDTTWVIWRYDWPFEEGEHLFEVRCAEADGTPQIEETRQARPSGATGIDNFMARL